MSPEIDFSKLKEGKGVPPKAGGSLAGAVDLGNPINQGIAKFKEFMLAQQGSAFICIGMTGQGQVIVMNHTPNGKVETLGLLQFALAMASPALPAVGPTAGAEYEEVPDEPPQQASE